MKILGGTPRPSDLGPEEADRREIWHAPQKLRKERGLIVLFFSSKIAYFISMIIYANFMHK